MSAEIPDNAPVFEEPSKIKYGNYCVHASYTVNEQHRKIVCNSCGGPLDPFVIVLQRARRERLSDDLSDELKKKRARLNDLLGEEKRVKARTRNARKKDAEAAVRDALKKAEEDHNRTVIDLLGALVSLKSALKRLGRNQDEDRGFDRHAEDPR